jgi:photosystem II stability/assembly factor-like uncharacterized protein
MKGSHWGRHSIGARLATVLALATATILLVGRPLGPIEAQAVDDWRLTPLIGRAIELYTPASGAFFARTESGLFRSNDAGASWAPVSLPPPPGPSTNTPATPGAVAITPTDHTVLYAAGSGGLYKSGDDAATWTIAWATPTRILNVAVSPADSNLVFLALGRGSDSFEFLRSRDAGGSWEVLEGPLQATLCGWSVPVLEPHPTDAARLFRTSGCYAGRDVPSGDSLDQSRDQGAGFALLFHPRPLFPSRLVGGRGVAPGRYYLSAQFGGAPGGGRVFRTDDDGASWADVLQSPTGPAVTGLTYDPDAPDRVYAGLSSGAVKRSTDGGASWADLGRQDLGRLNDLALGIDGANLYAATEQGVGRMRLDGPSGPGPQPPPQVPAR